MENYYKMKKFKIRGVEETFKEAEVNKIKTKRIKLDNEKLNQFFGKGILQNCVTEIIGKNGSGKTQFALTLCAEQLLNISQKLKNKKHVNSNTDKREIILYVYVNRDFPIHRLVQILKHKLTKSKSEKEYNTPSTTKSDIDKNYEESNKEIVKEKDKEEETKEEIVKKDLKKDLKQDPKETDERNEEEQNVRHILQNLFIKKITDETELFIFFKKQILEILKKYYVSFMVVDSVNSVFNSVRNMEKYKKTQLLMKLSLLFNKITYTYDCFILLLNSSYMKYDKDDYSFVIHENTLIPSFANTVIVFKKFVKNRTVLRKMYIQYSQYINKFRILNFKISEKGFEVL